MTERRQPALISKCTPSLIRKLMDLGYRRVSSTGYDIIVTYVAGSFGTYQLTDLYKFDIYDVVNCGRNEEMFIAIASLSNIEDTNQWFIMPNGDWRICRCMSRCDEFGDYEEDEPRPRKASVDDIKKHFMLDAATFSSKMEKINYLCQHLPEQPKCRIMNDDAPYRILRSITYDGVNTLFGFGTVGEYELEVYISEIEIL